MDESCDDDVLEPLPVYEDSAPVPSAPVARSWRPGDRFAIRRKPTGATPAGETWNFTPPPGFIAGAVRTPLGPVRQTSATFTRTTALNPALLADLPNWWRRRADDARVRVGGRLLLEAPSLEASGTWRLRGALRSPWLRRWIPVELQLWPRLGAWTRVSLEPQHDVRPGRRYFSTGHRALDALTARLTTELHPGSRADREGDG